MERLVLRFIVASAVYFVIGMTLGVLLIFWPEWPPVMRTVHVHVNVLGWVSMIVYAVGYYLAPRLTGRLLYSPRAGDVQFWLANAALVAMSVFWVIVSVQEKGTLGYAFFYSFFAFSTVLVWLSGLLFVYNIVMTVIRR